MNYKVVRMRKLLITFTISFIAICLTGCSEKEHKPTTERTLVATPDWKNQNITNIC